MIIRYPMEMHQGPRAMRGQRSRPIVEALIEWGEVQAADALPESGLGEAVHCVLNQTETLTRYLDDG
ncbi:MAG: transposase, partial [Phycisphaeraceae bacterium]|nr:transposase [Phycisphaeraceae bacterium]